MSKVKVLFLAADPASADPSRPLDEQPPRLRIDEEMREIAAKVGAAEYRDSLEFISRGAVRADDLLQALNQVRPHVVHFSGHASQTGEIIVVGRDGTPQPIGKEALFGLFRTLKDDVRVVFLNACRSEAQAERITGVIDCAIGMSGPLEDDAAITFAASFYRALGFGRSVQAAFEQGTVALQLHEIPGHGTPRLLAREGVDPAKVVLVPPTTPALRRIAVIREELQRNLQALAGQIFHTRLNVPDGNPVPRRPGETRAQFEDRDREWFARAVEHVFSGYRQSALEDAVYASQRVNLAELDEKQRWFITQAYAASDEVENRVFLYRDSLQRLATSDAADSERRRALTQLYARKAANALASLWFQLLENWLMLGPDETELAIVQDLLPQVLNEGSPLELAAAILPGMLSQVLADGSPVPRLQAGADGWRYAVEQRGRLHREKMALDQEEMNLRPGGDVRPDGDPGATGFLDALGRASLAYLEGRPENAVTFLEQALRFPDVPEDQRHFARTSLAFLNDPDAFDGVCGAYLLHVEPAGAAAQAGFRKGDVIVRYNGEPVPEPGVLSRLVPQARGAPLVPVEAVRDGERSIRYLKGGASLGITVTALVFVESLAV